MLTVTLIAALQATAPGVETPEVGRYQMAYPAPSPDGSQLVLEANFDGRFQLYLMAVETGELTRAHTSQANDSSPVFSPDGRRIAFVSDRDGHDDIYLLDLDSGTVTAVAPHPGKDGHPKFSADGRYLWFNRTFDPADIDGSEDAAIVRLDLTTGVIETIADTARIETFPSPSPDGRRVAFVDWQDGPDGTAGANTEIVVLDLASGERVNVTNHAGWDGYPAWGGDGWIYHVSRTRLDDGSGDYDLYRVRPDGSAREALTAGNAIPDLRPMPDTGNRLVYFNQVHGGRVTIRSLAVEPA